MERTELTFTFERSTKNTQRYQEVAEYDPPAVGTLYIHKSVAGSNPPQTLRVVIEVV